MNRFYLVLISLISFFNLSSQDFILKTDGKVIQTKIDEIGMDIIKYHIYTDQNGEAKSINTGDVTKIYFDNGGIQVFGNEVVNESILISQIKKSVVENINKNGFMYRFPKQKFKASFEGKFLRIDIINKRTNEPINGISYDFSVVYSFDGVSIRRDDKAYVNIWASMLLNKKKNNWKKGKFVIGVHGHDNAYTIMGFIKFYHRLLLEEDQIPTQLSRSTIESKLLFQKVYIHSVRS